MTQHRPPESDGGVYKLGSKGLSNRLTRATPPYIILRVKYFTDPEGPMLIAGVLAGIIAGGVVYWFVDRRFSSGNFRWAALVLAGTLVGWIRPPHLVEVLIMNIVIRMRTIPRTMMSRVLGS